MKIKLLLWGGLVGTLMAQGALWAEDAPPKGENLNFSTAVSTESNPSTETAVSAEPEPADLAVDVSPATEEPSVEDSSPSVKTSESESPAQAVSTPEKPANPLFSKAMMRLEQGEWRDAKALAQDLRRINRKSPEPWFVLGRVRYLRSDFKKAIKRFKKALKYDPQFAPAYYWRGKAYEARGKQDEAANEYQAAFHADAQHEPARAAWERLSGLASITTEPEAPEP